MLLGSHFDGISAFPYAASFYGIKAIWATEIEPFPIQVSKRHFPDMKHYGDITKVNGAEIEPVDVITFGSPCQDLSIAGKRAGLEGERSHLFYEATRTAKEMLDATDGKYPKFLIWENVPGALSSNKGQDIKAVLDNFEGLGFVVDMNILDAQYMGVPQRRKRVFAVCVNVNHILQSKTLLSASIITQLLTEILQSILDVRLKVSESGQEESDLVLKNRIRDGLSRRMNLFKITSVRDWLELLKHWDETLAMCPKELGKTVCSLGRSDTTKKTDIDIKESSMKMESGNISGDILRLWKNIWEEVLSLVNSSTTLTVTRETTQSIIYTCSLLSLNIAERIVRSKLYCQNLLTEELSGLTVMKECIGYAKQASSGLFAEVEWVQCWNDYLSRSSHCREQLERYITEGCGQKILPKCQGMSGHTAESRKAREEVAAGAGDSTPNASYWDGGQISDTLDCSMLSKQQAMPEKRRFAAVLTPQLYDMTATRYKGGGPTRKGDGAGNGLGVGREGDPMPTMTAGDRHAVFSVDCRNLYENEEISATLQCKATGGYSLNYQNPVRVGYAVRRLTPTEAERLMGFPDGWTEGGSDTARYKALGNSIAVPCLKWIFSQLVKQARGDRHR